MENTRPWYDTFFSDYYNKVYTFLTPERTRKECEFIRNILELQSEHRILDIPCGFGRHAIEFTRQGFSVTGMEYHPEQIAQARRNMEQEGIKFPLIQADMRDIPHKNEYDRLYNYFTSFGFFNDEENEATLRQFWSALKPGGVLLIETIHRNYLLRNFLSSRITRNEDSSILLTETQLDLLTGIDKSTQTLIEPGAGVNERKLELRLYTPRELMALLRKAGFEILKVCDSTLKDLTLDSTRLVITARKMPDGEGRDA